MAWTAPRTWLAGELVKEGDLNAQIRDNLLILKTPLDNTGKIQAISLTYFVDMTGTDLTGIAKTNSSNAFTAGNQDFNGATTRFILPVGSDKWGTP